MKNKLLFLTVIGPVATIGVLTLSIMKVLKIGKK